MTLQNVAYVRALGGGLVFTVWFALRIPRGADRRG
jgi:hypothetical protein